MELRLKNRLLRPLARGRTRNDGIICSLEIAVAVMLVLMGCVSIPEPSPKNNRMVYATTKCSVVDKTGDAVEMNFKNNLKVDMTLKSFKAKKSYDLQSNTKGEIVEFGIPEGTYYISAIKAEFQYNSRTWTFDASPNENDVDVHLMVKNGVTNFGVVKVKVYLESESGEMTWLNTPEIAEDTFRTRYPESAWNDIEWFDAK